MAKDKMMQQANWEKKKEKLDKKKDTDRGKGRLNEKIDKKFQKDVNYFKAKEMVLSKNARAAETRIMAFRAAGCLLSLGIYAGGMWLMSSWHNQTMDELSTQGVFDKVNVQTLWDSNVPAIFTAVTVLVVSLVFKVTGDWKTQLVREEEQKEAAGLIKGTLEKSKLDKERAERLEARRKQQAIEAKERLKRRKEEEDSEMQRAREIARLLRKRREEREAEEKREAEAAKKAASQAGGGAADAHGWTALQRNQLRAAVAQYPEGWSHSRKQRWEMIASEVDDQDARACEATWARLQEEKEAGRAEAHAKESTGTQANVNADLDWMDGDMDDIGGFSTSAAGGESDEEEEEEEEEDEEEAAKNRMAVEIEPEHKGTEIRLENIKTMQGCATLQVEVLHLQLSCADCKESCRVYLSGADEETSDAKLWCEGCTGLLAVRLRPTLLHQASNRLCYVDCVRCNVTDVLPSVLASVCEGCDAINAHKQEFVRNRTVNGTCFKCHFKYAFQAESIRIEQVTPCDPGHSGGRPGRGSSSKDNSDDPMDEIAEELRYLRKKAKSDPRQQLIKLGSPLPQMGACKHFKKSYKWYRFACCGRAFPCPECHVESGCPAAALGAHASRMICGKCSMEQSYSPARGCEKCGFAMVAKGSSHWDGGDGTRNVAVMSTKDAKKFRGSAAKTTSNKSARVGTKAKAKREHQKKFGRD
eukprot:TRINITY_DN17404_c0_g1_i1.p1 TRINITY_DN17404_c0_g1~~TRINITY_DN17404_c0_g1_i1.p1  ORF type:complete len:700 (-),score=182.30 TRINITY_DN17404_c0_g1_i1:121-2220(-)